MSEKIVITPADDPHALDAEIEIIAKDETETITTILCVVKPGKTYAGRGVMAEYITKCTKLGFEKVGYSFSKHHSIQVLMPYPSGGWYVYLHTGKK